MPKRGYKKAEKQVLSTSQLSPLTTRSGLQRNVIWAPQVDLQDAIREADENLRRMAEEANSSIPSTSPNSRATSHQDTQRTPHSALQRLQELQASRASGRTTPRSVFDTMRRRRLSLSPSGNTDDTGGATARSPLDEETEDSLIDMPGIGQTNPNKNLEDSLESDSSVR